MATRTRKNAAARFDDHAWNIVHFRTYALCYLANEIERRGNLWRYFR